MDEQDILLLSAYMDDELTPAEKAMVEARLLAEKALHQELEELRAVSALLRQMPLLKAPRSYALPVAAKRRVIPWRGWLPAAAAALVLVIFGAVLLRSGEQNMQDGALTAFQERDTYATMPAPEIALQTTLAEPAALNDAAEESAEESAALAPLPSPSPAPTQQLELEQAAPQVAQGAAAPPPAAAMDALPGESASDMMGRSMPSDDETGAATLGALPEAYEGEMPQPLERLNRLLARLQQLLWALLP